MTRDDVTLYDVARAARLARDFASRVEDVHALEDDLMVPSAILHQLMVAGEAVKRLSSSYRERHSSIPWSEVARTRDRLIHGYDDIDLEVVWTTATEGLPALLRQIEPLLPRL